MLAKQIVPGFYAVSLGMVNVFLLEGSEGLVLFDAGMPNHADKILAAVRELGKQPSDLRHIVLTHSHPDHFGSLAALKRATSATTYAHALEADWVRRGGNFDPVHGERPLYPAPTLLSKMMLKLLVKPYVGIEASPVEVELKAGDTLSFADHMHVIFAPGHSIGQLVFWWEKHGGLLIAADTCANLFGMGWSVGYEDLEAGKQSLKLLCDYDFEAAVFGHGGAIKHGASTQWRKRWGKL